MSEGTHTSELTPSEGLEEGALNQGLNPSLYTNNEAPPASTFQPGERSNVGVGTWEGGSAAQEGQGDAGEGAQGVVPPPVGGEAESGSEGEKDIDEMTLGELQDVAKSQELPYSGRNKDQLHDELVAHFASKGETETPGDE